jgi:ATP-dependent RNA helicase HelY
VTGPGVGDTLRAQVVARLGFALDPFQSTACDALDEGRSVLVSAPTGSGKTVVADYAVARARARGQRAFYTTPLKALSNQKYSELAEVYGADSVGLLTGDVSHRADAAVVVMTTEVLRNMLFARSPQLEGLGLVVLDEVHYLQDPYRGSVWEEVIILTAPEVAFVCLSATVSNAEQFGAWLSTVRGPTEVVIETHRPVELRNHVAIAEKGSRRVELVPLLHNHKVHPKALALDQRVARLARRPGGVRHSRLVGPRRSELIEALDDLSMLPAIVFIFSRAACDDAVAQCLSDGLYLTSPEERVEIRRRCEEHTEGLPEEELRVLGYGPWAAGLEAGLGSHHAGLIPAFREAVEDCFSSNLLRVVFATETLSLGINMPARTVVIERLTKIRESGRSGLSSGEYAQMTGRAGRRGLDSVGHAVVVWSPQVSMSQVAALATSPPPDLRSSFRATYNLAVNLVRRYRVDQAHFILDRSFAQFLDSAHHHALSRRLDRALGLLEHFGYVDLSAWRLTARGAILAGIYHESDLLVAEALAEGLFDGLDPGELAAVVSSCTFETRPGRGPVVSSPPKALRARLTAVLDVAQRVRTEEEATHLARTRLPDDGFADVAWRWARGQRLDRVLERAELAPGDFVRNVKQLIDLLRQLAVVGQPDTAASARQAAALLQRGVVAASAGPALPLDDLGRRPAAPGGETADPEVDFVPPERDARAPGEGGPGSRSR